ncbi:MAG: dynamin family protein [Gammaproteobacteria bacterium]|nr:dynamin family protein [Gammaproteobacteria bacterium]
MTQHHFSDQMQAFGQWKHDLIDSIQTYQAWLEKNHLIQPETELRLFEMVDALRTDQMSIAFVAEFARGKTELINTIFFSDYGMRLLPSEPGRTTMCPTELFFDKKTKKNYLKLLPIETRLSDAGIQEHKKHASSWRTIILDTHSPESMAEAFKEVVRTKRVSLEDALRLGLYDPKQDADRVNPDGYIDIPRWRHALISFAHPLLQEGLTILDTPGLNALGAEPELTLSMLPNAQAIVFVLSADTGISKSDLDMWKHHVSALGSDSEHGRIVVLNKVDTLWDDLKSDDAIKKIINDQCQAVANQLSLNENNVVPVSAQKALLARVRKDKALETRSNIKALEDILGEDILPKKQYILRQNILAEIGAMIDESRKLVMSRLNSVNKQIKELQGLSGKNEDVIQHLLQKTRDDKALYQKSLKSLKLNRKLFLYEYKQLSTILSLGELDKLMADTRKQMAGTWTTKGLRDSMQNFFGIINNSIEKAAKQSHKTNILLQTIFRKFDEDHNLGGTLPKVFLVNKFRREIDRINLEAEAFRKSPVTAMTEQSFVIKKFFISLVSSVRNSFYVTSLDAKRWQKTAMSPLFSRLKELKYQIDKRIDSLKKISESRESLQQRINELEISAEKLNSQLADINTLIETINRPLESFLENEKTAA